MRAAPASLLRLLRATPYDRPILALAVPALGALAADPLVSLVDTAFVGHLGPKALGALGVNAAVFSLVFFLFNFLAYGTTPLVGQALGEGRPEAARRTVGQAVVLAMGIGLVVLAVLGTLAGPILTAMGAGAELVAPALVYLRIRALAAPAVLLVMVGHGAFRGYQDTRTPLLITLGLNAVNLTLDPLLIFGLGWGIAGAAWGTVAAQWFGAAWFVGLLVRRELTLLSWRTGGTELLRLLRVGGDLTLRTLALLGTLTLATAVAARLGTVAVAAHQVAAQLWGFLALVVDALAIAAQALVARLLGSGNQEAARLAAGRMLQWGVLLGLLLGVGFWALQGLLPGIFTDDPGVTAAVMTVLPFVAAMQPLNSAVFVWDGVFMGAGDFPFLAKAMLLAAGAAGIVLLLVLPLGWGLVGVWWGMVTLMLVRALTLGARYFSGRGPLNRV
ncbi:MAG: MATE family efflux transporter [Actinomycetota bacterium]|nr:MATE family efflux transporter [Actinomycetota bacterium]